MRDVIKLTSVLLAVVLTVACGARNEQLSSVQHDVDAPTRGAEPWMWANVTDAQYKTHIAPLVGIDASAVLSQDHALTKRLQMWLDRIDTMLRTAHPQDMALTPKPRAKVVKEGSTNAFVAPAPVCYDLPVKVRSGSATASTTADVVYLDAKSGEISAWPTDLKCLSGTDAVATIKRFVDDFNAASAGVCTLAVTGGKLVPSDGCARGSDLGNTVAARSVAIMQTANHVTVFTGLVVSMTEPEFVAVVSHELGHYYRSHSNVAASDYDFFYTMPDDGNHDHRPVADESLRQLGESAIAGSTLLNSSELYRSVSGQKLRPEMFLAAGSVVKSVCAAGDCPSECETANSYLNDEDFTDAIGRYPFGRAASGEAAAYKQFEAKALACLARLDVGTGSQVHADSISWTSILALTMQPVWPDWLGALPAGTQAALGRYMALSALRMGETTDETNVAAAFKAAAATMNDQDDESEAALKQAYARRLGYYTFEQEADDEAAEWMADLGFEPRHAIAAMQALGRGDETSLRGMLFGEDQCTSLFQNDWLNSSGSPVFVPVGDYSEIHHSACFRMFNIDREIAAHNLAPSGATLPAHGGSAWLGLQQQAAGLGGEPESMGGVVQLHSIVKNTGLARCSYAQSKFL
jgi:hypothetical protein